ncbi:MAG: 16S rRNA (cytidine(1402)-2'-O)-methyltransferase, partial [Dehalococcoidia bacterium]
EFTLVIAGAPFAGPPPDEALAIEELVRLKRAGVRAREASVQVSRSTGVPRRRLYDAWQGLPE